MATYGGRRLPSFLMEDKALATFGRRPPDSSNKPSETEMSAGFRAEFEGSDQLQDLLEEVRRE